MLTESLRDWAPLPLRVALGVGLIIHGGIKLFVSGGHENIVHMIQLLGVPLPESMGWVVGLVEFFGGWGMLLGAYVLITAGLNAINIAGLLVFAAVAGGIPEPLPGGDPLPAWREAFLILAGALTLVFGGAGRWDLNEILQKWRQYRNEHRKMAE